MWAVHAVTHVYEMQGRVDEGIAFLRSREADWGSGNLFTVHNWWHLALYLLEAGRIDDALAIYDAQIHNSESAGVPIEMLDASALLWRLFLEGEDTGGRFGPLADAWATRSGDVPWYAFNDLHAVMAFVGAGRIDDASLVIERLDRYVAAGGGPEVTNLAMTSEIGLPASRAIVATARGDYAAVIEHLLPIRNVFQHFGGSHAQRDALQRTLLNAAIRSGELDLAGALVSERIALRESSVYGLARAAEIAAAKSDGVAAKAYERAAAANRERFSAVIVIRAGASGSPMPGVPTARRAPVGSDLLRHSFSCRPRRVVTKRRDPKWAVRPTAPDVHRPPESAPDPSSNVGDAEGRTSAYIPARWPTPRPQNDRPRRAERPSCSWRSSSWPRSRT